MQPLSLLQLKLKQNFISSNSSYTEDSFQTSSSTPISSLSSSGVFSSSGLSSSIGVSNNQSSELTSSTATFNSVDIAYLQQQIQELQIRLRDSQLNQAQPSSSSQLPIQQQSNAVQQEINKLKVQFKNLYFKSKRYSSHIEYFDKYLKDDKVPPALFNNNMPRPFLPCNNSFVEEYNKLIREFQTATIKLCHKHLNLALNNDVNPLLSSIRS